MRKSARKTQSLDSSHAHRPLVIAHRGASGLAPENTLAAFKLAIAMGAEGLELDAHLSGDGQPVVIHDARLNRTTNSTGRVADLNAADLQRLDAGSWFTRWLALSPRRRKMLEQLRLPDGSSLHGAISGPIARLTTDFSDARVPTLKEVFALCAAAQLKRIYVELKGEAARKQALLDAIIGLVHQFALQSVVTLLSFDHQILKQARNLAPDLRIAATFSTPKNALTTSRSIIQTLEYIRADEAALHFGLATRRMVAALHKQNYAVSVWTANRKIIMRRLTASGVDAIMTDFPNRLIEVLESSK